MKPLLLSSVSHNTILSRIPSLTSESYRAILTDAAKRLGLGS